LAALALTSAVAGAQSGPVVDGTSPPITAGVLQLAGVPSLASCVKISVVTSPPAIARDKFRASGYPNPLDAGAFQDSRSEQNMRAVIVTNNCTEQVRLAGFGCAETRMRTDGKTDTGPGGIVSWTAGEVAGFLAVPINGSLLPGTSQSRTWLWDNNARSYPPTKNDYGTDRVEVLVSFTYGAWPEALAFDPKSNDPQPFFLKSQAMDRFVGKQLTNSPSGYANSKSEGRYPANFRQGGRGPQARSCADADPAVGWGK
jgi:hypothetical protein